MYLLGFVGLTLFDTWHPLMLQRRCLGVQRLSIYATLATIMVPSIFHAIVTSIFHATITLVAEFCVSRAATWSFESRGH